MSQVLTFIAKRFKMSLLFLINGGIIMKLKHHLWIAFAIIVIALFLTTIVTATSVPAFGVDKESTTSIWNLMWENLFTSIPKDNVIAALGNLGVDEATANVLIEQNNTGNSVLSGLLGLLPILATISGILLLQLKKNSKNLLYIPFAVVFVSLWVIWFTAPSKLNGVESMYNAVMPTLGTAMRNGTDITMGVGFFLVLLGSLYGIIALLLNKYEKIAE